MPKRRFRATALITGIASLLSIAVVSATITDVAQAAVTVTRAEVSGSRLRIDGRAASKRAIRVDGVQMATSSSSGSFKIDRSGYTRPADCTVDISDGTVPVTNVRLSGCTVTTPTTTTTTTTRPPRPHRHPR